MTIYALILAFWVGFALFAWGVVGAVKHTDPDAGTGVTRIVTGALIAFAAARIIMG
jgi:hypothetical protein